MCQPYADFRWVDVDNFDVINVALDSLPDYVLEIDLKYPQHIHSSPIYRLILRVNCLTEYAEDSECVAIKKFVVTKCI